MINGGKDMVSLWPISKTNKSNMCFLIEKFDTFKL